MTNFISEILTATDYAELLGEYYQPVCATIVTIYAIIAFGAFAQAFANLLSVFFRGRGQ